MKKMRAMGLNTLCMYSFWNLHEPVKGQFDFTDNLDIATFIRTAQEEGLLGDRTAGPLQLCRVGVRRLSLVAP